QVRGVVERTPSLSRISLVGNSLGGLYVRYAVKLLYRAGGAAAAGETVAGLKPSVFMTIASPHLGVRRFTYVPLPTPLHALASVFVGKTGSDLFLERNGGRAGSGVGVGVGAGTGVGVGTGKAGREASLLYEMATSEEFLRPLKAFRWRRAYANRRGDFMVPYGTAAFVSPGEGDGSETPTTTKPPAEAVAGGGGRGRGPGAGGGGGGGAAKGGRGGGGAFTVADRVLGAKHGAIVGMARVPPAAPAGAMAGAGTGDGVEVGVGVGAGA
ncbi:unnamed protein product, partial [Laminaria digitata]